LNSSPQPWTLDIDISANTVRLRFTGELNVDLVVHAPKCEYSSTGA
jgi:hypothetical protein